MSGVFQMSIHTFPKATWKNRFRKRYFSKLQKISSYTSSNNTVDNFECLTLVVLENLSTIFHHSSFFKISLILAKLAVRIFCNSEVLR